MSWLKENQGRLLLDVAAVPNARKTEIVGEYNGRLKIKIQAPPTDGRANKEILEFLTELLDIGKNQIELIKGGTSRQKTFAIKGVSYLDGLNKLLSTSSSRSG